MKQAMPTHATPKVRMRSWLILLELKKKVLVSLERKLQVLVTQLVRVRVLCLRQGELDAAGSIPARDSLCGSVAQSDSALAFYERTQFLSGVLARGCGFDPRQSQLKLVFNTGSSVSELVQGVRLKSQSLRDCPRRDLMVARPRGFKPHLMKTCTS